MNINPGIVSTFLEGTQKTITNAASAMAENALEQAAAAGGSVQRIHGRLMTISGIANNAQNEILPAVQFFIIIFILVMLVKFYSSGNYTRMIVTGLAGILVLFVAYNPTILRTLGEGIGNAIFG